MGTNCHSLVSCRIEKPSADQISLADCFRYYWGDDTYVYDPSEWNSLRNVTMIDVDFSLSTDNYMFVTPTAVQNRAAFLSFLNASD